jgi:hypothetical protein
MSHRHWPEKWPCGLQSQATCGLHPQHAGWIHLFVVADKNVGLVMPVEVVVGFGKRTMRY